MKPNKMKISISSVKTFLLVILLLSGGTLNAANDALLRQGVRYAYNFDIDRAYKVFTQISKTDKLDPRPYYYKSQITLWKYIGNSDPEDLAEMLKNADICIEKLRTWEPKGKSGAEISNTWLGNIYMQKSIAYGKAEKYVEMVNSSQKSYSYLSELVKANPANYDAYLGLGLFKFALSRVPSSVSYLLNVAGFKTNLDEAYTYVAKAAQKGTFTKVEAQYYLGELQREYLFDYKESIKSLNALTYKYPGNLLFTYSLGVTHIKNHQLDEGKRAIQRILTREAKRFQQLYAFSNMLVGDIHFYQNKFAQAIPFYQKFLQESKTKDFTGIAHLRLGLCLQFTNKMDLAIKHYEHAAEGNHSLDDDAFAQAKSILYKKLPPDLNELRLFKFANYIEAGAYKRAVDSLVFLLSVVAAEDKAPVVKYYLSQAYFFKGDMKQSLQFSQEIIVNKRNNDDWMKPFSYFNSARIKFRMGDKEAAKGMLTKAEQYSDFLYASLLKNRVEALRFAMQKSNKK